MKSVEELNIKLFADGADISEIQMMSQNPRIRGFTTNPTLMRRAGISDYKQFALNMLQVVPDRPVSFEVFSDDFYEMEQQALEISSWGKNVFVKIPVTNTASESAVPLLTKLSSMGVQLNVTALMTLEQVQEVAYALAPVSSAYISVFAGRIADTGRDPVPLMAQAVNLLKDYPHIELIWASPRELLNVFQADSIGCHIITATNEILKKLNLVGKDLDSYSLETVTMFRKDALEAGYTINLSDLNS